MVASGGPSVPLLGVRQIARNIDVVGFMRRLLLFGIVLAAAGVTVDSHIITTRVTWNREVSRIVYARCATCHRPGGTAFSLLTYGEASPWADLIKADVLRRTMPPWGAVQGFGTFRNDPSLMQEEIDLITAWVIGGVPEGNPNDLPLRPSIPEPVAVNHRRDEFVVSAGYRFERSFTLDGFWALNPPKDKSIQVTIQLPDGRVEPLVWLRGDTAENGHPFLLRRPLTITPGATIRGLPAGTNLMLLPATQS
jgi:hypothetical protein